MLLLGSGPHVGPQIISQGFQKFLEPLFKPFLGINKSCRGDLNSRPPPYQGDALPAELQQHQGKILNNEMIPRRGKNVNSKLNLLMKSFANNINYLHNSRKFFPYLRASFCYGIDILCHLKTRGHKIISTHNTSKKIVFDKRIRYDIR